MTSPNTNLNRTNRELLCPDPLISHRAFDRITQEKPLGTGAYPSVPTDTETARTALDDMRRHDRVRDAVIAGTVIFAATALTLTGQALLHLQTAGGLREQRDELEVQRQQFSVLPPDLQVQLETQTITPNESVSSERP